MRIRYLSLPLVLLLIPNAAHADDHFADAFIAFSYASASMLLGPHVSLAKTLPNKDISVVGDFSAHFGSHEGEDVTRVAYLIGVRYTRGTGADPRNLPSLHVLVGGTHTHDRVADGNQPAFVVGGAWEHLRRRNRQGEGWGFRTQLDYIVRDGGENYPRLSGGITIRMRRMGE